MNKQPVWPGTPSGQSPYSPGIITGNLVFVSGQVPMDPSTKKIREKGFGYKFADPQHIDLHKLQHKHEGYR
jgi:enamine deaminase RidA (YjgF/YER057c/UK114 family)